MHESMWHLRSQPLCRAAYWRSAVEIYSELRPLDTALPTAQLTQPLVHVVARHIQPHIVSTTALYLPTSFNPLATTLRNREFMLFHPRSDIRQLKLPRAPFISLVSPLCYELAASHSLAYLQT
jgi:hypothetical protein